MEEKDDTLQAAAKDRPHDGRITDLEEVRLVRRAREGDMQAFEALYRRLVPRVYGLCLRMAADRGLAEELTQEAFVRAWEKLSLFRGDRPFAPWLLTVTTNVVLSHRRYRRRKTDREHGVDDLDSFSNSGTSERPGRGVDLERAIVGLPDGARKVFVLHDIEGYKHHEIAGMLGIAIGTTKAQLHRARRMLREALAT